VSGEDDGPGPVPADREESERGPGAEFAVLIPIIEHGGEDCLLLTKRLETLPEYSGHVSFPGGARDPGDADLSATARRETGEEVGIGPDRIRILDELPPRSTSLGHRVKPYLARVVPGPVLANPLEVERILYVPLAVLRTDPFTFRTWRDPSGRVRTTPTFRFEGLEIWGLTARIIQDCCRRGLFAAPPPGR
jgi:8-oxo-dGTP pyrophosphatase MutT (NUDIX family)